MGREFIYTLLGACPPYRWSGKLTLPLKVREIYMMFAEDGFRCEVKADKVRRTRRLLMASLVLVLHLIVKFVHLATAISCPTDILHHVLGLVHP